MTELATRALERAAGQAEILPNGEAVGTEHPKGSNWGHPVQDYLASVNTHFPASWCMAFVYWCVDGAAKQLGLDNPLARTGGVLAGFNGAKAPAIASRVLENIAPGDVFIMDLGHGLGHTGFVTAVTEESREIENKTKLVKVIKTIEGNTNDTGSREGYEVARRSRAILPGGPFRGFIRI